VCATDLRAGAALICAGLVAEGVTEVSGVHHIDRGYMDIVGKLASLGADIYRAPSSKEVAEEAAEQVSRRPAAVYAKEERAAEVPLIHVQPTLA